MQKVGKLRNLFTDDSVIQKQCPAIVAGPLGTKKCRNESMYKRVIKSITLYMCSFCGEVYYE